MTRWLLVAAVLLLPPAARAADAERSAPVRLPVGILVGASYDRGFADLSPRRGAASLSVAFVLPLADGRFEAQLGATGREAFLEVGDEHFRVGNAELGGAVNLGAWRLGAGVLGLLGGPLGPDEGSAEPSLGGTLRVEYVFRNPQRWRLALGPQLSYARLRSDRVSDEDEVSVGISFRVDSDPAAWKLRRASRAPGA